MAIVVFTNEFGGESLLVTRDSNLADVPLPYCELLTAEHYSAFANPREYFSELANRCEIETMQRWLARMALIGRCDIEINRHVYGNAVVAKVERYQVLLRSNPDMTGFCESLRRVFGLIDGTLNCGYGNAGGFSSPRSAHKEGLHFRANHNPPVPLEALVFYSSENGDNVISIGENAFWHSHETGDLTPAGSVADLLTRYFHNLNAGEGSPGYPHSR